MQKARLLFLVVCLTFIITVGTRADVVATAQPRSSDTAFKTPEDTITAFMQGVIRNDVTKIMQAAAVDEMSENFKFDLYIARLGVLVPYQSPAPADSLFYAEMNKAKMTWEILSQVRTFAFSLLSTEAIADGKIIQMDADRISRFMKDVDPARLAKLEVKTIGRPNPTVMDTARYIENTAKQARVFGADELTERIALVQFEGNFYLMGFTLLRYGESWKVMSMTSPLSNLSSSGAPQKTTEQGFEQLLR